MQHGTLRKFLIYKHMNTWPETLLKHSLVFISTDWKQYFKWSIMLLQDFLKFKVIIIITQYYTISYLIPLKKYVYCFINFMNLAINNCYL